MRRLGYSILILLACASCTNKGRQFSVTSAIKGPLSSGDSVQFTITHKKDKTPDSVVVIIDGKNLTYHNTNECVIQTEGLLLGDKNIEFAVYYKGKKEVNYRSMRVLSDITPTQLQYEVVAEYPHDKNAYTQGLQYENGKFYESAGLYGKSSLRYTDVKTGNVLRKAEIDSQYFAEGLTLVGDTLYQFTWREQTGFMYDKNTFKKLREFSYTTEGWGMCYNGEFIIVSDGTEFLYFYEPVTFKLHHKIAVFNNRGAVSLLNELEFVNGFIYANIYTTNTIVKINPSNGKVATEIDFSSLLPKQYADDVDVLNGIAWNQENDHFYITGKLWPRLYEVRLYYKNSVEK